MPKAQRPYQRPRTTVPLTGTVRTAQARLSAPAAAALEEAAAWLLQTSRLKHAPSAVIRRALELYALRLRGIPVGSVEARIEAVAAATASKALRPERDSVPLLATATALCIADHEEAHDD